MVAQTVEQRAGAGGKLRRNLHLVIGAVVSAGLVVAVLLGTGKQDTPRQDAKTQEQQTPPPVQPIMEVIQSQKREAKAPEPPAGPPPDEFISQMRRQVQTTPGRSQEEIERAKREAEALASPISLNLGPVEARAAAPATPSAVESILLKQAEAAAQATKSRDNEIAAALKAAASAPAVQSPAQANAQWLETEAQRSAVSGPILAHRPAWRYTVQAGSVIPATLLTRINSDLPGMVTAQVVSDIYDSLTSSVLLIPKGSRLVGRYNSEVRPGQERVLIAFHRIYFPDGRYADLGAMQGADAIGQSGLEDKVDNHFFRMFGASFLIAGVSRIFGDRTEVTINNFGGGSTVTTDVVGTALSDAARAALDRHRNIPPTIVIEEGLRFNVMVSRDLALEPYVRP